MLFPLQVSAVKYHTKAMSTFHQVNAFEEDGFLMLDLCCADDGKAINNYLIQNMRKSGEALTQVKPPRLWHLLGCLLEQGGLCLQEGAPCR